MKHGRKVTFYSPTSDEVEELCYLLAKKIKKARFFPEMIVGICRGGWVPARYLADLLGDIKNMANMKAEFYTGIEKTKRGVVITQPVSANVKGKRVLLVDDVADTGVTLKKAVGHLKKKGAKEVRVAALHYKPWSILKPDFYVKKTKAWIIYPWMVRENLEELREKGEDLRKTGIAKKKIDRVLSL